MCISDLHPKADTAGEKAQEKKCRVYVGFMVNEEVLWQVLRMYDVGGKMLNGVIGILTVYPVLE